jgi:hypothetical protein
MLQAAVPAAVPLLSNLPAAVIAIGALGTAAFGLVDALKALPGGGISRAGFKFIRQVIETLAPSVPSLEASGLGRESMLHTLLSQWINGTATSDQVNIAKSLIKLRLTPETAPALAAATGVDPTILTQVAQSIATGTSLTTQQSDVYGRFDLLLTTLLDQAYQRADQRYRNTAKFWAIPISVVIAVAAAHNLPAGTAPVSTWAAVLVGLIATPLAPIAKDIASAIQTGAQALQTLKS